MATKNEIETLRMELKKLESITNEQWLAGLNPRKRAELDFHNKDRDRKRVAEIGKDDFEKYYGNKKYYTTVERSTGYTVDWIRKHAAGKIFLDYACGNGQYAIKAAQAGAALAIGIDISDESIRNARADAAALGLQNAAFAQADAENTRLPDDSVDTVLCSGMLHHLDLSYAFPELRRILKPGGRILAVEALNWNPFIRLYRKFTKDMRTEWEKNHILGFSDLAFASRFFEVREIKFWHVTGYLGAHLRSLGRLFETADRLLEKIPLAQRMAWIFTFELRSLK